MCSLMHSTNPLPPIPSASDSIKAGKNKQITCVIQQGQDITNTDPKES